MISLGSPASAGSTLCARSRQPARLDHPRAGGEHVLTLAERVPEHRPIDHEFPEGVIAT
ncbi:hypothetical protein ABZ826_25880 [Streptomyces sp. NPDC047515]|uniref:hypothetical protein n=1 Tax=Streptomyces sp. NPDC047515 TaxID=3155380 RepID=UPI0033F9714C